MLIVYVYTILLLDQRYNTVGVLHPASSQVSSVKVQYRYDRACQRFWISICFVIRDQSQVSNIVLINPLATSDDFFVQIHSNTPIQVVQVLVIRGLPELICSFAVGK